MFEEQSFKMRKFFYETKMITTVAIFATIVAIGLDLTNDFQFKGILSNVCYSIIAAYIFYLVQIYFPERKKRRLLSIRLRGYLIEEIFGNLNNITSKLDKYSRETLSEEDVDFVIESATEAYNNLFKCIDGFGQTIDDVTLDVIVGLSENQLIYDLNSLKYDSLDYCASRDWIYSSYEEYGDDFKSLKDRIRKLAFNLPQYDKELSDDIEKKGKSR